MSYRTSVRQSNEPAVICLPIRNKKQWHMFLLALPLIVLVVLFCYVPLFGWILSLFEYHAGTPIFQNKFVGLKYFNMIISDRNMIRVMKNTLVFSVCGFLLQPLPMIFAILINELGWGRFKKTAQTMTTLPHFISWIIVYSLAFSIFSTDGVLNNTLLGMGLIREPTNVLGNPDAVYWFQIIILRWKELGWGAIIYIAALSGIDQELYEAAHIDGAGRLRMVWHITLPGLMPTFVVLLLLGVASFVDVGFQQYFVFRNSLVYDNIEVLDLYAYRVGLEQFDYSYATAVGISKSAISLAMLFGSNAVAKRVRGESII